MNSTKRMKLLVIEGVDGAGKSTQTRLLRDYLSRIGYDCEYMHFPRTDAPYFGELIALDTIIEKIDAVKQEDVQEIAEELFKEDRFATVIFHPNGNHETTTK